MKVRQIFEQVVAENSGVPLERVREVLAKIDEEVLPWPHRYDREVAADEATLVKEGFSNDPRLPLVAEMVRAVGRQG